MSKIWSKDVHHMTYLNTNQK